MNSGFRITPHSILRLKVVQSFGKDCGYHFQASVFEKFWEPSLPAAMSMCISDFPKLDQRF
jgi:hypothetical protein